MERYRLVTLQSLDDGHAQEKAKAQMDCTKIRLFATNVHLYAISDSAIQATPSQ